MFQFHFARYLVWSYYDRYFGETKFKLMSRVPILTLHVGDLEVVNKLLNDRMVHERLTPLKEKLKASPSSLVLIGVSGFMVEPGYLALMLDRQWPDVDREVIRWELEGPTMTTPKYWIITKKSSIADRNLMHSLDSMRFRNPDAAKRRVPGGRVASVYSRYEDFLAYYGADPSLLHTSEYYLAPLIWAQLMNNSEAWVMLSTSRISNPQCVRLKVREEKEPILRVESLEEAHERCTLALWRFSAYTFKGLEGLEKELTKERGISEYKFNSEGLQKVKKVLLSSRGSSVPLDHEWEKRSIPLLYLGFIGKSLSPIESTLYESPLVPDLRHFNEGKLVWRSFYDPQDKQGLISKDIKQIHKKFDIRPEWASTIFVIKDASYRKWMPSFVSRRSESDAQAYARRGWINREEIRLYGGMNVAPAERLSFFQYNANTNFVLNYIEHRAVNAYHKNLNNDCKSLELVQTLVTGGFDAEDKRDCERCVLINDLLINTQKDRRHYYFEPHMSRLQPAKHVKRIAMLVDATKEGEALFEHKKNTTWNQIQGEHILEEPHHETDKTFRDLHYQALVNGITGKVYPNSEGLKKDMRLLTFSPSVSLFESNVAYNSWNDKRWSDLKKGICLFVMEEHSEIQKEILGRMAKDPDLNQKLSLHPYVTHLRRDGNFNRDMGYRFGDQKVQEIRQMSAEDRLKWRKEPVDSHSLHPFLLDYYEDWIDLTPGRMRNNRTWRVYAQKAAVNLSALENAFFGQLGVPNHRCAKGARLVFHIGSEAMKTTKQDLHYLRWEYIQCIDFAVKTLKCQVIALFPSLDPEDEYRSVVHLHSEGHLEKEFKMASVNSSGYGGRNRLTVRSLNELLRRVEKKPGFKSS